MTVFYCGNVKTPSNIYITSSWRTKYFFVIDLHLLSLSSMISHNSDVFLYLNSLKPCIENVDIFWYIWNLVLWREAVKKRSSFSDDSKYGAFILLQSKQQFKIQSHFVIFNPVIGEGNDMITQHHMILNVYVNYFEIFYSCIQWNHA